MYLVLYSVHRSESPLLHQYFTVFSLLPKPDACRHVAGIHKYLGSIATAAVGSFTLQDVVYYVARLTAAKNCVTVSIS
jgi:hypothetical protein